MKSVLSALMDGEVESARIDRCLDRLLHSRQACRDWVVYHLIGDCLRRNRAGAVRADYRIDRRTHHFLPVRHTPSPRVALPQPVRFR